MPEIITQTDEPLGPKFASTSTQINTNEMVPERQLASIALNPDPGEVTQATVAEQIDESVAEDYLEEIRKFSEFVYTRAYKQLVRILDTISASVGEQVDQLDGKRRKQQSSEADLTRLRAALKAKKSEALAAEVRAKAIPDKATEKAKYDAQIKLQAVKMDVKELEERITTATSDLVTIKDQFAKVPNEGVYNQAFRSLDGAVQEYVKTVRERALRVTKSRKDGPMHKIEQEDLDTAAEAMSIVLKRIVDELVEYLTYTSKVGNSEIGTPRFLDANIEIDRQNVESSADLGQYSSRLATFERIRINRFNSIASALRDIETVHQEVGEKLSKPISLWASVEAFNIGLLYALKISRIGLLFSASFVSTRVFETLYTERMSSKQPDVPDLKWLVAAFVAFSVMFDIMLIGVAYLVATILPDKLDSRVISDFAVDTIVAHTMVALSLFPIADIIQDSRWFDYQVHAPRALRLMRQICFSLSSFHAVVPYFYLTGPFYIQYKKSVVGD